MLGEKKMSKKISENFSRPGGNPHDRPILMRDGKIIDQDATVIEDSIIADGMRYISKMTRGLATGVLSEDEEYIRLQNRVIDGLIKTKSSETRKKIETDSKQKIKQYAEAHKVHQQALDKMYAKSSRLAKDNTLNFFIDDNNEVYQTVSSAPVVVGDGMSGRWRRINLRELKKNIDEREAKYEAARKEREAAKEAEKKKFADKMNSMAKKKTKKKAKKKIAKKKTKKRIPKK